MKTLPSTLKFPRAPFKTGVPENGRLARKGDQKHQECTQAGEANLEWKMHIKHQC